MADFMDWFSGVTSGGLGLLGQYLNVGYQKELQEHAGAVNYRYAEKTARNAPTWNRAGLESAGFNPMLAVQNATSGANAGWTTTGQTNPVDLAGDFSTGINNATNIQHMQNETKQTNSTIRLNEANTRNVIQDAISKEIHNKYLDNREQKELGQIAAETDKLIRETSYFDQLAENMEAQRRLQEMGINLDYKAKLYAADKGYSGTVYNADTLFDIANEHQPTGSSASFKNYAGGVRDIMSGIGDIIHGRNDTYENYDESVQHSSRDKKTGVTTTTKSRKTGRRKK